jgi:hypothetical protein
MPQTVPSRSTWRAPAAAIGVAAALAALLVAVFGGMA